MSRHCDVDNIAESSSYNLKTMFYRKECLLIIWKAGCFFIGFSSPTLHFTRCTRVRSDQV